MARKKIKPIDLSDTVTELLQEYGDEVYDVVQRAANDVSEEASEKLRQIRTWAKHHPNSPYSRSWTHSKEKVSRTAYAEVVYNEDHYRLTHLLEHGHVLRDGSGRDVGKTGKYPHIKDVDDWAAKALEDRIRGELG